MSVLQNCMFAQLLNPKRTGTFPVRNVPTDIVTWNETSTFLNAESELFTVTTRVTQTLQSQQFPTKAGGGAGLFWQAMANVSRAKTPR
jgi:hypothetical protein